MAFNQTKWEFSDEKEAEMTGFQLPPEGDRYLTIEDAEFDEKTRKYRLWFVDIGTNTKFVMIYNMDMVDKSTGQVVANPMSRNTLISLNFALFGERQGIPYPGDIVGGVVGAEIKYREYEGKKYVNIKKYSPVNADMVVYSSIEQYYEGYSEE